MKCAVFCLLALAAVALARPNEQYTNKYDDVNLKEILGNGRLYTGYYKCITDEGNCTPDGKELKSHIQEALENDCAKCTPAQKNGAEEVISYMIKNKQENWEKVKTKYDPSGKFSKQYEDRLKAIKA